MFAKITMVNNDEWLKRLRISVFTETHIVDICAITMCGLLFR